MNATTPADPDAPVLSAGDENVGMDPRMSGADTAMAPGDVADPMRSEKAWVVPGWIKGAFFWGTLAMVLGLVGYKLWERGRYEAILVETVMDPTPMEIVAPDFTLGDGEGGAPVKLSDLRGRFVFVNFWATWCPPCREEMPSMEFLSRKFGDKMVFLAITVDEDWNEVRRFFGSEKSTFRVLWDPKRESSKSYGTEKFPETYIVNPEGRVVVKFVGPRDWNTQASEEYFSKLIGG